MRQRHSSITTHKKDPSFGRSFLAEVILRRPCEWRTSQGGVKEHLWSQPGLDGSPGEQRGWWRARLTRGAHHKFKGRAGQPWRMWWTAKEKSPGVTLRLLLFVSDWLPAPESFLGFPGSSVGKESACSVWDPGLIPGWGRSSEEAIGYPLQYSWAFLVVQLVKNPPAMQETWDQSLGWEDALEKGKATLSSILAWIIPWSL